MLSRDDIIRVMRELLGPESEGWAVDEALLEEWMPFFQALAAAEREACARVADQADDMGSVNQRLIKRRIAAAIRARSKT